MANTQPLKDRVEPYVRSWLSKRYGQRFHTDFLPLVGCAGRHEFDAVSADGKIVGAIKCSSGKTSGKKNPSGKLASLFQELYYLCSIEADKRLIVLTSGEFYELAIRRTQGKLSRNIEILHCSLPAELEEVVAGVCKEASGEIDRGKPLARK